MSDLKFYYLKQADGTCIQADKEIYPEAIELTNDQIDFCWDGFRIKGDTTGRDDYHKTGQLIYDYQTNISDLRQYLNETDYVISKLNELKLEDEEEYESEKEKYSEVLAKRKEARSSVREMENKLPELQARLDKLYKQKEQKADN